MTTQLVKNMIFVQKVYLAPLDNDPGVGNKVCQKPNILQTTIGSLLDMHTARVSDINKLP